jgi:hypothetical protein
MAHTEPGQNLWEKTVSAVEKYKSATGTPVTPKANADVQAMVDATQTPTPQARTTGDKKMWKESVLRAEMQKKMKSGEWQRDPHWRNLFDQAYRDGRVLRGQ